MKSLKIYSLNVNGLRAAEKKGLISWIQIEQPDILSFQETRIQEEGLSKSLKNIPGYHGYFVYSQRKGFDGVATYTKIKPLSIQAGLGIKKYDKEGRVLICEFDKFIHINFYFPNGQFNEERLKYKLQFFKQVIRYSKKLYATGKKIIISGDFNTIYSEVDLAQVKIKKKISGFLPEEFILMDELINIGFIDTFRYLNKETVKFSWWSYRQRGREKGKGWRIDYQLVSKNLLPNLKEADILEKIQLSDHCPVTLTLQF